MSDFILHKALTIANGDVDSTTVPVDAIAAWDSGTTYALDDEVIASDKIYVSAQGSNTNNNPTTDDGTWWTYKSVTNPYRMFDQIVNSQSTDSSTIEVEVIPSSFVNRASIINVQGARATVTVTDDTAGEVYNETKLLRQYAGEVSWYNFFFADRQQDESVSFGGIPNYLGATVKLTVEPVSGEDASVGEFVLGQAVTLGQTQYGASIGIQDYSAKQTNDFGQTLIVERAFAKRASFDIWLDSNDVSAVQKALAGVRATPAVYIGSEELEETIVFGFYRDFDIVLQSLNHSLCTIEVEGLV